MTREQLVELSARQRAALVSAIEPLVHRAAALDRIAGYVRNHPTALAIGVGAVALLVPRNVFRLAGRALTVYALLKR